MLRLAAAAGAASLLEIETSAWGTALGIVREGLLRRGDSPPGLPWQTIESTLRAAAPRVRGGGTAATAP